MPLPLVYEDVEYIVNGEPVTQDTLNRPILNLDNNVQALFDLVNSADPFTQYTTDSEAAQIAEDQAILYAIALG